MRYVGSDQVVFVDIRGKAVTILDTPDQVLYDNTIQYDKFPDTDLDLAAVKLWGSGSEPRYYILFDANAENIMELKDPFDLTKLNKLNVPL